MSENLEPFWYKLIINEKSQGKITTGLTIPFILGAKSQKDTSYIIDETSIKRLFDEIINCSTEQVAFFQECLCIRQFVIGLTHRTDYVAKQVSELILTNSDGEESLYIAESNFGNNIEEISQNLTNLWLSDLLNERFSWDVGIKEWRKFCEKEKARIDSYDL